MKFFLLLFFFFFFFFFFTVPISAQDISIVAPDGPVQPNELVILEIKGIRGDEIKMSKASLTPQVGVKFYFLKFSDDQPCILFQTKIPGEYLVTISMNAWKEQLESGMSGAAFAKIDSVLLSELQAVVTKVGHKYTTKSGSAVVVVSGIVDPTPPVDPKPPVDQTTRIDRVTYVYEKDSNNIPRPVAFALQRLNNEYKNVVASEFEDDTVDGMGQVPDQYKIALEAAQKAGLPALVIQAGIRVVKVVSAPTTETQVMDTVLK